MTSGTRSVNGRLAKVAEAEVDEVGDACLGGGGARLREHPRRRVDADHANAGARDRDGDATGADGELDDRPARLDRQVDVEADVLGDGAAPRVVERRDLVVQAHQPGFRATHDELAALVVERSPIEPAVERLDLEAGDVDEPFPLGACDPPQRENRERPRS